ncbi:MAG: hypothetical protein EOO13_08645 [Chitinophagaceae bacterium]|nr:MAG: hypothetical protein EOO13_08645 [Chitinophagaceae bacterium]
MTFDATFVSSAYSYKINVMVEDRLLCFERDEQSNFRAFLPFDDEEGMGSIDQEMVREIALELMDLFKDP